MTRLLLGLSLALAACGGTSHEETLIDYASNFYGLWHGSGMLTHGTTSTGGIVTQEVTATGPNRLRYQDSVCPLTGIVSDSTRLD